MIDFVFAMIAAGMNAGGDAPVASAQAALTQETAAQAPQIVPIPLPEAVQPVTPTVSIGENVAVGGGVVIGGNASVNMAGTPAQSGQSNAGGGLSLLDGTSDAAAPQAAAAAPMPATAAPAPAEASPFNMAVVPAGLTADPQDPTGKFTTAAEVKPILNATRGNWVAVREYNGQDLVYVTHLWGWRCGLKAMAISLNGEAMQNWPLPPCHMKYATPNAVLEDDGLPYLTLKPGAVQTIDIQIVYDDLSMDAASFERGNVLIP